MQALTAKLYVDDIDTEQSGIAEMALSDSTIANVAKPGTSFHALANPSDNLSQAMR